MHVPSVSALPGVPPPQLPRSRTRRRCAVLCAKAATASSTWLPAAGAVSLDQGLARTSRVVTLFQPTPRGGALVASSGEAGERSEGRVHAGAFFNRTAELEVLATLLAGAPTAVLFLTGPPSCGKSALLKRLVADVKQSPRPTVVNCRAGDYMSPAAFSAHLVKCTKNDWQLGNEWLLSVFPSLANKVTGSASGTEVNEFVKAELQKDPQTALQTITDAYLTLAKDVKQKRKEGDPWPLIIIDEANALMEWKDTESLSALLKFFVYLTKEEQLAHVILATSDTFLTQWLETGPIKEEFRDVFWMGNLSREEARTYFFDYVLPNFKHLPGANEAWERVYEVCGGNPGLLLKCAGAAVGRNSWKLGCDAIVRTARTRISSGLIPETWEGAAWSTEDCRTVLQKIVSSPHAAVPVVELVVELGGGGAAKLKSMNAMNLLLRRAYDPLVRDIDAAAFGAEFEDVYTLPSAAHVLAARRKLRSFST